jgi:hypothetical protein
MAAEALELAIVPVGEDLLNDSDEGTNASVAQAATATECGTL